MIHEANPLIAEIAATRERLCPPDMKRGRPIAVGPDPQMRLDLPSRWGVASLEQVTDPVRTVSYGILKPGPNVPSGVPYVRVVNMRNGRIDLNDLHRTSGEISSRYTRSILSEGDVLVSIRGTYGRVASVSRDLSGANITQDAARLAFLPEIDSRFAAHYLQSPIAQSYFKRVARGVAVKGVNIGDLRTLPFPVPPRSEQWRIVEMIDDHLSRLDAAAASFRIAAARLETLLDAWFAEQVDDCKSQPLGQLLAEPLANGRSVPTADEGFPVLRLTALRDSSVDLSECKLGAWSEDEARSFLVSRGDFLVARGNGSLHLLARGGLVRADPHPVAFPDTMIRIRPSGIWLHSEYLALVWNSRYVRRQIESSARTTAGIYKVNQRQLQCVRLPMCSLSEQQVIVSEAQRLIDGVVRQRLTIERSKCRSSALRSALLAAAFSGQLTGVRDVSEVVEEMAGV